MFKLLWKKIKPLLFELLEGLLSDLITELFSDDKFLNASSTYKRQIIKAKVRKHAKK